MNGTILGHVLAHARRDPSRLMARDGAALVVDAEKDMLPAADDAGLPASARHCGQARQQAIEKRARHDSESSDPLTGSHVLRFIFDACLMRSC